MELLKKRDVLCILITSCGNFLIVEILVLFLYYYFSKFEMYNSEVQLVNDMYHFCYYCYCYYFCYYFYYYYIDYSYSFIFHEQCSLQHM